MKKIENREGGLKQILQPSKMCAVHCDKPIFARGLCKNCYDKWLKQNNPKYLEKQRLNCSEWIKNNKEKKKSGDKKWRVKQDPDYGRIRNLMKYGLTLDDYEFILKNQGGACAICGKLPNSNKRLHIDHDHETGMIRGLLCFRCNFGLSYFAENSYILGTAAEYLKTSGERGKEITKQLDQRIDARNADDKKETDSFKNILAVSVTKEMTIQDKKQIKKLYGEGVRICDIKRQFPQYSRSAISRVVHKGEQ